jgi:predicted acyltransferase
MPGHLYENWTTHNTRDPEGLLSDIPAVGSALLGLLTGMWLRSSRAVGVKTQGLAVACVGLLASGYPWSVWFPLNKKLWTSSYVLVSAGWSLALLTVAYWAIEQRGWFKGRGKVGIWTWLVFGSNAIVAYMISELLPGVLDNINLQVDGHAKSLGTVLSAPIFTYIHDPGWAAFSYSVAYTAVCFVPVWLLYRKRIFVKV